MNKIGYSYSDCSIVPAIISKISSRSQCNPYDENNMLPIFGSTMDCVANVNNQDVWIENKITPILPRTTVSIEERLKQCLENGKWIAVSLKEFEKHFIEEAKNIKSCSTYRVCIDIANGHMEYLYNTIDKAKELAKFYSYSLIIMAGNIANPKTCEYILRWHNIDYIRLSIGTGNCCITSSNTGIHYPIASLIKECCKIKKQYNKDVKIVADGGIRNYSDVVKALALGADYVMIGSLFGSMKESAAENVYDDFGRIKEKKIYGMSTKIAQSKINPENLKTSEGICRTVKSEYNISQWVENMTAYLKSAMSYCNAKTLAEFIGVPEIIINSYGTMFSVNK